jgi:hypothetical protein
LCGGHKLILGLFTQGYNLIGGSRFPFRVNGLKESGRYQEQFQLILGSLDKTRDDPALVDLITRWTVSRYLSEVSPYRGPLIEIQLFSACDVAFRDSFLAIGRIARENALSDSLRETE